MRNYSISIKPCTGPTNTRHFCTCAGDRFQCQKRYKLYDVAQTDADGNVWFRTLAEGDSTAFDPDPEEQALTGEYGLCVDLDYSHQQGCKDKTLSAVMDGAIGCFDRQVSMFLCGLELNVS